MKTRSQKLARLVAVQRYLEQIAESELADTTRQRQVVSETMDVVAAAMSSPDPMHQMFSSVYSTQMGRLTHKDRILSGVQEVQEARVLKERVKADRLEENRKSAREMEDREEADTAIYDLVDQQLAGAPASGKLGKV